MEYPHTFQSLVEIPRPNRKMSLRIVAGGDYYFPARIAYAKRFGQVFAN
jgi:hypothetical protein